MSEVRLRVYGATWCPDCRRSTAFLDGRGVAYDWVDVDSDEAASAEVVRLNSGARIIPTIVKPNGEFVAEPSDDALAEFLHLAP